MGKGRRSGFITSPIKVLPPFKMNPKKYKKYKWQLKTPEGKVIDRFHYSNAAVQWKRKYQKIYRTPLKLEPIENEKS